MGWLTRIKDSLLSKIKKKIPKKDLESVEKTRQEKKIETNKEEILKCAEDLRFDISNYEIVHEPVENNTAKIAAKLASEKK